jgi:hypothetical protein
MVSRRILISSVLLISALSQVGCCCHKRNAFRVQNSCCAPAPTSCGCEPVTSYRPANSFVEPMPAQSMNSPPVFMQQAH